MNEASIKSFISNFEFKKNLLMYTYNKSFEIMISKPIDSTSNTIKGEIHVKKEHGPDEIISFNTHFTSPTDSEMMAFKTQYTVQNKTKECIDTFTITTLEPKYFYGQKNKYLLHISNGRVINAYTLPKKYNMLGTGG